MANNRFIKTKSNYTFRKKKLSLPDGDIFERDYMTINNDGESNFRFTSNPSVNFQRKHSSYDAGESFGDDEGFFLKSTDSHVVLNPDYEMLSDFVFYGSARELIRTSLNNIIMNFPAEVIFNNDGNLDNQYRIDFFTQYVKTEEAYNQYRYMSRSWKDYELIYPDGSKSAILLWKCDILPGEEPVPPCPDNDDRIFCTIYHEGGEIMLKREFDRKKEVWRENIISDIPEKCIRMRLKPDKCVEEMSKLSDFEKILLNDKTNPIYRSVFYTPIEKDNGISMQKKDYIWPSSTGYNPDIDTVAFHKYEESLYNLAYFFDSVKTDNIWTTMVHDAIKKQDYSFKVNDDEAIGDSSRIHASIEAWGHQFDLLKRYIDNIGNMNNVSYDFRNTVPEYAMRDKLALSGWEVKQVYASSDRSLMTDALYPSMSLGYGTLEANTFFMKALKLNSNYIFSRKGTKEAIRALLGLFGFDREDYDLNEFISIAKGKNIEGYQEHGYPRYEEVAKYINYSPGETTDEKIRSLEGIPVKYVSLIDNEGNNTEYLVPWMDYDTWYSGSPYFQMKGGWCEQNKKKVKNIFSEDKEIVEIERNVSKDDYLRIFDETAPLLKICKDIDSISGSYSGELMKKFEVIYITDITGLDERYTEEDSSVKHDMDEFSHYFILYDIRFCYTLGYNVANKTYGWKNVFKKEFDSNNLSTDAKRVLYIESLIETNEGNNPHIGYYEYDSGESYFDIFRSIVTPPMSYNISDEEHDKILEIGFDIDGHKMDDKKVWYFHDTLAEPSGMVLLAKPMEGLEDGDPWGSKSTTVDDVKVIGPYNPEGREPYDEAAANSILNTKYFQIAFKIPVGASEDFKNSMEKYITDVVMFYVKQVIPSTSILRFFFLENGGYPTIKSYSQRGKTHINSVLNKDRVFIA